MVKDGTLSQVSVNIVMITRLQINTIHSVKIQNVEKERYGIKMEYVSFVSIPYLHLICIVANSQLAETTK